MDYVDWLADEYEPRLVKPYELEEGLKSIKPLDFVVLRDWSDLKLVAEKKMQLKRSTDKECEQFLDVTFVSCFFDDWCGGKGYRGSVVCVTPYDVQNDVKHWVFKDRLVKMFDGLHGVDWFSRCIDE